MIGARCLFAEPDELLKLDQAIRIFVGRCGNEEKKIRRRRNAQMIPILGYGLITKRVGARLDHLASIVWGWRALRTASGTPESLQAPIVSTL